MKINKLNIIIVLGLFAIIGILVAQLLWTKQAFSLEEKKFSQKTHIALLEVAKKLYEGTNHELPLENPVKQIANDYYIVNIENDFDPKILEYYLKTEFIKRNIITDFEYAMYNCQSDEMVYGNYISLSNNSKKKTSIYFPKHKNLIYYFAVRFPNESSYLLNSLKFWFVLSIGLIFILLIYVYSIWTILQQKKYTELQRDFINNMTHEFKTPLSSILIASNYLKNQKEILENNKLSNYTKIIINQSNKLNNHIEKILTIAKTDSSQMILDKKRAEIIPIIEDVIENIKLKYENVEVKILSDNPNLEIELDTFHFTNLVYNLLDNAVKYCDSKPEIIIKISNSASKINLEFIDNAIGISDDNKKHIFDKFYRIKADSNNQINGFGLGLYYVKKICDLHKWKIVVKNNPKKGITVSILVSVIN